MALTDQQRTFLDEYFGASKSNATEAYQRAYLVEDRHNASVAAARLMTLPEVRAEADRRRAELRAAAGLTAADIVRELFLVASADPRDLIEYYRGACRHCYGEGFKYQRTPAEFDRDLAQYLKDNKAEARKGSAAFDPLGMDFPHLGGVGFTPRREPVAACPECFGEGVGYAYPKDTRTLSPSAARLYAGVKQTRDGLEIKMRSPDKAIELAGQHLGLFKTAVTLSAPGGGPLQSETKVTLGADPIEAAKLYQALIGK